MGCPIDRQEDRGGVAVQGLSCVVRSCVARCPCQPCTQRLAGLTRGWTGRCSGADEGLSDGASADATLYRLLVCIELMRVL